VPGCGSLASIRPPLTLRMKRGPSFLRPAAFTTSAIFAPTGWTVYEMPSSSSPLKIEMADTLSVPNTVSASGTHVQPCQHTIGQHLGQAVDHEQHRQQQAAKGYEPPEKLGELGKYTDPASRSYNVATHGEKRLGDVVHQRVSNQCRSEQANDGQRGTHEERHQQQVALSL
jgi:hypothetical protein